MTTRVPEFFVTDVLPLTDEGEFVQLTFSRGLGERSTPVVTLMFTPLAIAKLARDLAMGNPPPTH